MKTSRSLIFAASLVTMIAIIPAAHAQAGTATLISAKGDVSQVATTDLAKFTDVLGRKSFNLDLKGFGGLIFDQGKFQGGLVDAGLFVSVGWKL